MTSKLNNLPLGVLVGVVATGLPIWLYAEKQIEKRTTIANSVSDLKAKHDSLTAMDETLHRRISESAQQDEKDRKELQERLRASEYYLQRVEIDVAVLKATKPKKP